jgi:hypothetical protein
MKTSRNAPCPCGSGRKYKHCCGKPSNQIDGDDLAFTNAFIELPSSVKTHYLDTCVWSEIVNSKKLKKSFAAYLRSDKYVAGLSYFTLFELSRAPHDFGDYDRLFFDIRQNVWLPLLLDQVTDLEIENYPSMWRMRWLPSLVFFDKNNSSFLETLANDDRFIKSREEHRQFGHDHFMSLEQFKENYPPGNGESYTPDDVGLFAWGNAMDYLSRHFPAFLRPFLNGTSSFEAELLPTVYMRSLLLFYKYYIHDQSPIESDFMDFAHVSYAPYCDVYVTEKNVCNVLRHIKKSGAALSNTRIVHITDFLKELA